eukprot:TRINITY_DN2638_c0_g1_i5.p1 TRINITY_DN2638_c0_g1~~TRINITY_DN2638_c0_g1_i5.p1  ORF type:complete len:201 (+),score=29.79 TRINITY_DN2638_c0_g1_i5:134-736(+)
MSAPFIDNFPFLKERIENDPFFALTEDDLKRITQEIIMNDSIQYFGIPSFNRNEQPQWFSSLTSVSSPLLNALKLNTSITTLDLSGWNLVQLNTMLAEVIMLNNTITELDLSRHYFGPEMMNAIRINSAIQKLNLKKCGFDNKRFKNTRGTSPNLISLDISGTDFNFTFVAEWLKDNVSLTSLTLSGKTETYLYQTRSYV